MKGIILAAGQGSRLKHLTRETPKPMLDINGKPMLEYIIRYLKKNGFDEIGINLFTMSEQITDFFGDGSDFGVSIKYSHETQLLGTAGSLTPFRNWLGREDFLVIYGDILTNQTLVPLLKIHKENKAFATLLLHRRKESNSFIELDKKSRVVNFLERPNEEIKAILKKQNPEGYLVNSALQLLSNKILEYIEKHNCFDLPRDIYCKVCHEKGIYGVELTGERIAIDSPERYSLAKGTALKGVFEF